MNKIIEILAYTTPAIVTGVVAYYIFSQFINHQKNLEKLKLHKKFQEQTLPLRLEAYERMTLFLERINPNQLLLRIKPIDDDISNYFNSLLSSIEHEFEHNISQQIYISQMTWDMIVSAKNSLIHTLKNEANSDKNKTASDFQQAVIKSCMDKPQLSHKALLYIKDEVAELFD